MTLVRETMPDHMLPLRRYQWGASFEASDFITSNAEQSLHTFNKSHLTDELTREVWSRLDTVSNIIDLDFYCYYFRAVPNSHGEDPDGDPRAFWNLTSKKRNFFFENSLTVGEMTFVLSRWTEAVTVPGFFNGGVFADLANSFQEIRPMVPHGEAFGWCLILAQLGFRFTDITEATKTILDGGFSFDDLTPYANNGMRDRELFLPALLHGIDTTILDSFKGVLV
jgi:hypothetical protein